MIQLNVSYSTRTLAKALNISYDHFRKYRREYEDHLTKFYRYRIQHKGNGTYYIFETELYEYIPYKEYKTLQRSSTLQKHIKDTIYYDNRQTGANIARIIKVNGEIKALNWKLSTLTVYTRDELKALVDTGYYIKEDYKWCYLDKLKNQYVLMDKEEVERLRSFFHTKESDEQEENILACQEEGGISIAEADEALGILHRENFMQGRFRYQEETGHYPIKVPVYKRNAIIIDNGEV